MIRTLICSVFLRRCLGLYNYEKANLVFVTYLTVFTCFYISLTTTIFIPGKRGVNCKTDEKDWQTYSVIAVDTFQSVLILVTFLLNKRKTDMKERSESVLNDLETDI